MGPVGFPEVDDLAVAPDGTIFAAVNPVGVTAGGPVLATIDPNTGAGTVIGAYWILRRRAIFCTGWNSVRHG